MVYRFLIIFLLPFLAHAASVRVSQDKIFPYAHAPINMVKNPDCAKGVTNITDADSIVTANDTTPLTQDGDCAVDADASSEFAEWDVEDFSAVAAFLENGNCEARLSYSGDATLYEFGVFSGSTELAADALLNISSGAGEASINFPCGDLTTDPKIRITSTSASAAAINVARLYLGPATNVGSVAQPELAGQSYFATTASCLWDRTATTMGDFGTTAACPGPTIEKELLGDWQTTDTDLPQQTINNLPAGEYVLTTTLHAFGSNANSIDNYTVSDGTTTSGMGINQPYTASGGSEVTIVSVFTYTSAGNRTFKVQCRAGTGTCRINNQNGSSQITFNLKRYPTASEQVFKVGFPGQDWTAWTPTFAGMGTVASIDMEYQCQGGNLGFRGQFTVGTPTGSNATFSLPTNMAVRAGLNTLAGKWIRSNAGAAKGSYLQVVPGTDDGVIYFSPFLGAATTPTGIQTASGTDNFAPGDTVYVEGIVPVTADSPCPRSSAPLLKNAVTTSSDGVERIERLVVAACNSSPCTITSQSGSWVSSVTRSATGTYAINAATGTFSDTFSCTCNVYRANSVGGSCLPNPSSSTVLNFQIVENTSNTLADSTGAMSFTCMGPK